MFRLKATTDIHCMPRVGIWSGIAKTLHKTDKMTPGSMNTGVTWGKGWHSDLEHKCSNETHQNLPQSEKDTGLSILHPFLCMFASYTWQKNLASIFLPSKKTNMRRILFEKLPFVQADSSSSAFSLARLRASDAAALQRLALMLPWVQLAMLCILWATNFLTSPGSSLIPSCSSCCNQIHSQGCITVLLNHMSINVSRRTTSQECLWRLEYRQWLYCKSLLPSMIMRWILNLLASRQSSMCQHALQ